jgi:hypothetical protein
MKALIGVMLIGLLTGNAALAQISPAYNQLAPIDASPAPPPAMPDAPAALGAQPQAGTQIPGSSIPMPPLPVIPTVEPARPFLVPMDVNLPYNEPFMAPEFPAVPIAGQPLPAPAAARPTFWVSADYLFWVIKRAPEPLPLVVTGPVTDPYPGALDQPNTKILYGGDGLHYNPFSGMRLDAGIWFGGQSRFGFEMGGFTLEQKATQFTASGNALGQPFLARPFIDALTGFDNVYFVSQNFADPNRTALMTGGVEISSSSRLWAWDLNGLYNFHRDGDSAVNLIGGFTSVGLRENMTFGETLRNLAPGGGVSYLGVPVPPTIPVTTSDKFDTENTLYGAQLGARLHFQSGDLGVDLMGKAGIGVMQELVDIQGFTALGGPNNQFLARTPGGVYALLSNMGPHVQNRFGIAPQGNFDLTYNLTPNITLRAGYTFLYLNTVARPGNQINPKINPGLVPTDLTYGTPGGPAQPSFQFNTSSFWAQGINVGVEVQY